MGELSTFCTTVPYFSLFFPIFPKTRLALTSADLIVQFLKYLDKLKLQTERQDLLVVLLDREEFAKNLSSSPPEAIGSLLGYLGETDNQELAQKLLDNNWNQLDLASFEYRISASFQIAQIAALHF
ncbi:MAG: hypothetical protein QME81_03890 [bacterium]|nr:hypothetical protein [bacterium]